MEKQHKLRTSVVCIKNNALLTFVGIDPVTKKRIIFHPGGKPNKDETLVDCAQRETFEETGYKVSVNAEVIIVKNYDFVWNGVIYDCETHFYYANLLDESQSEIYDTEYNQGVFWCPLSELSQHFNYCIPILEATREILFLYNQKFDRKNYCFQS